MSYGYIYKTTNLLSGRFYIGQHRGEFCSSYLGSGVAINRAIKKHKRQSFKVECLVTANSRFDLDWLEKHLISEYRESGYRDILYNIADGGYGGGRIPGFVAWNRGLKGTFKQTEEVIQRIIAANKGRQKSEQERRALSLAHKGKPKSESHKQRLRGKRPSATGSNNHRWNPAAKYHKLNTYFCYDCGELITRFSTRCIPCRNKENGKKRWAK